MEKFKFKNDKYKKSRGGNSRLLDIGCGKCGYHICLYQKDGPGSLKRLYLDRISDNNKYTNLQDEPLKNVPNFICDNCLELIGVPSVYDKEKRLAYRLVTLAILKKKVK